MIKMGPILTSTPKVKRALFPGADGSDSVPSMGGEASSPASVEPMEPVLPKELDTESNQYSSTTLTTSAAMASSPTAVMQQQQQQQPLQRSKMSWQLSSYRDSDSDSLSSTGSDQSDNEGRDKFDPGML